MKQTITLIFISILFTMTLNAQEGKKRDFQLITSNLDSEELSILNREKILFRYGRERKGLYYIPMVPMSKVIENRFSILNPDVTVEALFKVPYPEDLPEGLDRDMIFYNILREVSNISGVEYFSRTKNKHRILFDDVYAIDNKKKAIADPVVYSIPEYDSFPIHMKEANLGRDYYLAEYHYNGKDISFSLTNTSSMAYIFKVVGEEHMQIDLLLMPLEKELLIYGYCGVKMANPGFVKTIMDPYSSFFRRLYAMEIWFSNTLLNEAKKPEPSLLDKGRN